MSRADRQTDAFPFEVCTDIHGRVWYSTYKPMGMPITMAGLSICYMCGQVGQVCCDAADGMNDHEINVSCMDVNEIEVFYKIRAHWATKPMCVVCCVEHGSKTRGAQKTP